MTNELHKTWHLNRFANVQGRLWIRLTGFRTLQCFQVNRITSGIVCLKPCQRFKNNARVPKQDCLLSFIVVNLGNTVFKITDKIIVVAKKLGGVV